MKHLNDLKNILEDSIKNALNLQEVTNHQWQILVDERKNKNPQLFLYDNHNKTILAFKRKFQEDKKQYKYFAQIKKYPFYNYESIDGKIRKNIASIENPKQLKDLFNNDNDIAYSFFEDLYTSADLNLKSKKIQKIAQGRKNLHDCYCSVMSAYSFNEITLIEKNEFLSTFEQFRLEHPDIKIKHNDNFFQHHFHLQEINILSEFFQIPYSSYKHLFNGTNFQTYNLEETDFGIAASYMFDKCKEKNKTSKRPLQYSDDESYFFIYNDVEFLYTQSQNGGYLLKRENSEIKGYMFGPDCLYKTKEDILATGLSDKELNFLADKDLKIQIIDSWNSYTNYLFISAVNLLHNPKIYQPCDEGEFKKILRQYQQEKKINDMKNHLEQIIPLSDGKMSKFKL